MMYLAFFTTLYINQLSAQQCQSLSCSTGQTYAECCESYSSICEWDEEDSECEGEGGMWTQSCCLATTPAPTTSTSTTTTTAQPTCPTTTTCSSNNQECCNANALCLWQQTEYCLEEGGPNCCERITTTTTPAPTTTTTTTTPAPTTTTTTSTTTTSTTSTTEFACPVNGKCVARKSAECCDAANACEWTCPEQEVSLTGECCEQQTTTTTPAPTTSTTTTTPAPITTTTTTTPAPITTTTTTSTTSTTKTRTTSTTRTYPTPRPTMKSAMKWEMIHPAYTGSDGELLWNVYYGDFSNDERFDEFRQKEMWDINEIRPVVDSDNTFRKYHTDESEKFKQENEQSVVGGSGGLYGKWLIVISTILIFMFIAWCKYGPEKKTAEYTPLLQNDKVQYAYVQ